MCFHSKQTKDAQTLMNRFNASLDPHANIISEHYNGFSFPETPVITNDKAETIQLFRWGLIPFWAKDNSIRAKTLNAKIETLDKLNSFRPHKKNRCLILSDGFFEWQWLDEKGKKKQQYIITLPNDEPFAFAGIYNHWTDKATGEVFSTYSIVTTEANSLMAEIHNNKKRMPVVLTRENEKQWLNGNDLVEFSIPEIELKATPY